MKDYLSILIKWTALNESNILAQKELLNDLNIEITKGFDVITRITNEEVDSQTGERFKNHANNMENVIAQLIFAGYKLFLIQGNIDPKEKNLIAETSTNVLGNVWMENFEKDQSKSLFEKIDPILSLMMEREVRNKLTAILQSDNTSDSTTYKVSFIIENLLVWAINQGYILGIIEHDLTNRPNNNP